MKNYEKAVILLYISPLYWTCDAWWIIKTYTVRFGHHISGC